MKQHHELYPTPGVKRGMWACLCSCGWVIAVPFVTKGDARKAGELHRSIALRVAEAADEVDSES